MSDISWLFSPEVQAFLKANEDKSPESFLLSKALANRGWDTKIIVRQLKGLKISQLKFPSWYSCHLILYPPAVSLEQASSEITARYKSSLVSDSIVDLSGGMGIDSYFLSRVATRLTYVEPSKELYDLSTHNFQALGAFHITTICATAEDFLTNHHESFEWVYVDPSRRKEGQRMTSFSAWEPDVVGLKNLIWEKTNHMLIKLSPMIDISAVCKEIGEVKEVHVVSDRNECKEILLVVEKGWEKPYRIVAALLKQDQKETYSFYQEEEQISLPQFSSALAYLYEPDVALLKAGAFKKIAIDYKLFKIHPHTHLYTSHSPVSHFLGRIFKVDAIVEYNKKNLKELIGSTKDFHVLTRNAALTADQIKTQWKLIERGDQYLIAYKGLDGLQYIAKTYRVQ